METASFNGVIKIMLYSLAFYYVFKFLARLFLPILAKKVVEKASQQFQQQHNPQQQQDNYQHKTTSTSDKPKEKKKVGEYVDFEEIE